MSAAPQSLTALAGRHPAFVLTVVYLAVSAVGLAFSWAFFRRFDVNYFVFADVTDFLLAAVREPFSIVAGASGVLLMAALYRYAHWESRVLGARPKRGRLLDLYYRMNRWALDSAWLSVFVVITYMVLLVVLYADWRAGVIQQGGGAPVAVSIGEAEPVGLSLLGSSARYLFLYDPEAQRTLIVPDESVTTLSVILSDPSSSLPSSYQAPPSADTSADGSPAPADSASSSRTGG